MLRGVFAAAEPTKLVLAVRARHVIAAAVLLNRGTALRTLSRVFFAPQVVRLVDLAVDLFPFSELFARALMPLVVTQKAELKVTPVTTHLAVLGVTDHRVAAAGFRTPPCIWILTERRL